MSNHSWIVALQQAIQALSKASPRVAIVGIGHELRGDDAVGMVIARRLPTKANWLVLDAGSAPENFTGKLCDFAPDVVLLIDAFQLNAPPGTIRLMEINAAQPQSPTTHTLSLHLLGDYLRTALGCDTLLLGIQPGQNALKVGLSEPVCQSITLIVQALQTDIMV